MKTHKQLALDNFKTADDTASTEWAITMLFYAAVHAVNHTVHSKGYAPPNYRHEDRRVDLLNHAALIPVSAQYTALEELSRDARYLPQNHPMSHQKRDHARTLAQTILRHLGFKPPA